MANLSSEAQRAQNRVSGLVAELATLHGVSAPIVRTVVGYKSDAIACFERPDGRFVKVPRITVIRVRRTDDDFEITACHEFLHYLDWYRGVRRGNGGHADHFFTQVDEMRVVLHATRRKVAA